MQDDDLAAACTVCGRPNRRGGPTCARCYMAAYRRTERGHERSLAAVKAYDKRHPDKRREWVRNWQRRTGQRSDDLRELFRALDALDRLLAGGRRRGRRGERSPRWRFCLRCGASFEAKPGNKRYVCGACRWALAAAQQRPPVRGAGA